MRKCGVALIVGLAIWPACTKSVGRCTSNQDCEDIAYPFCDVLGVYPASDGQKGVCTVRPSDCPAEQCGCTPGSTCAAGTLTTCNADGMSTTTQSCSLGCGDPSDHCATFAPSFGTGVVLPLADAVGGVAITAGSTISTDNGVVLDKNGNAIPLPHQIVAQVDGPEIQIFYAKSLVIDDVGIHGIKPAAFVTSGPLIVRGTLDVSANHTSAGPGALETGPSVGGYQSTNFAYAAGGGGNATAGASTLGGVPYAGTSLVGGGRGGDATHGGGAGGGAVQLASLDSISVLGNINAGGGGAAMAGGGGAGGTIVLEAPDVSISGIVAANGGAGNACSSTTSAPNGPLSAGPAVAPTCSVVANATTYPIGGGNGGTGTTAPVAGKTYVSPTLDTPAGSGGSVGRLIVGTRDGAFMVPPGVTVSAALSTNTLSIK